MIQAQSKTRAELIDRERAEILDSLAKAESLAKASLEWIQDAKLRMSCLPELEPAEEKEPVQA